jgi:hypothetical protein
MSFADNYELGMPYDGVVAISTQSEQTCKELCEQSNDIFTKANPFTGEPISSHAKGYEAVVHFGQPP